MIQTIAPIALFRLSVLGPLASREHLERGELKAIIKDLANKTYAIPNTRRTHVSAQAIERWYYAWRRGGIEALSPKTRCDRHKTLLPKSVQTALLAAKRDKPSRSINAVIELLEMQGIVAKGELSRATVHRFLRRHQLSQRTVADAATIERRSFVAARCGDIWHGDVMHGPRISTPQGMRKVYLVSMMDDASRLITHSAFCLGETALDVEGVLKQAVLKRGIPKKFIIDNGSAYRAHSLQSVCAHLQIRLIYCPAYEPQGKGKLERFHRTFRASFLDELDLTAIHSLEDLNARLWVWLEQTYHHRAHAGLGKDITPLMRWRADLIHVRRVNPQDNIDDLFLHRHSRKVRKDGTVQWEGDFYEVPYQYAGHTVMLVVDPHQEKALWIEDKDGCHLGDATPLQRQENTHRKRQRPIVAKTPDTQTEPVSMIEMIYNEHERALGVSLHNTNTGTDTDKENH
jgi:transposase InsO family protein